MLKLPELKLFKVTKTEHYYRDSDIVLEKYFSCKDRETIENYVIDNIGKIGCKYHQDDEEYDEIKIEEIEVEYVENRNSRSEDYKAECE